MSTPSQGRHCFTDVGVCVCLCVTINTKATPTQFSWGAPNIIPQLQGPFDTGDLDIQAQCQDCRVKFID